MNQFTIRLNKNAQNNFLVAMYICEASFATVLSLFVKLSHYPLYVLAFITFGIIVVNKKIRVDKMIKPLFLYIIILGLFGISAILNGFTNIREYLQYFVTFGVVALLVTTIDSDPREIIIYVIYIHLWFFIHYFLFIRRGFLVDVENYQARSMGFAYSLTIVIYIFIAYIFFGNKLNFSQKQKAACTLCSIIALYILLFECGTRGPVFSCLIGFVIAYIAHTKNKNKTVMLSVIGVIFVCIYLKLEAIVNYSIDTLSGHSMVPGFLKKIKWFIDKGNILNGRDILYNKAIGYITSNPITGHGIGYFEANAAGIYVHNIFLELLCTFGIVGTYFFIFYIFRNLKNFIVVKEKTNETIFYFVIISSFNALIFSNSFWLSPQFWYMFFLFYNKKRGLRNS